MLTHRFLAPAASLHEEMDRLFQDFFGPRKPENGSATLPVNVWEDDDAYFVEAEVPGLSEQDLEVSVQDRQLLLRGERKVALEPGVTVRRRERVSRQFRRVLEFPAPVNGEAVEAELVHGVLKVRLPKSEAAKARKIAVTTS